MDAKQKRRKTSRKAAKVKTKGQINFTGSSSGRGQTTKGNLLSQIFVAFAALL